MGSRLPSGSDGIERVTNGALVVLIGVIMVCAFLPVIVSQIMGLSSSSIASWSGLAGFQSIAYIIPTVLIAGIIIVAIRLFSNSRE